MPVIDYKVPQSVDDAVSLLEANENAKILAGGTDLIIQSRAQSSPDLVVVDLKSLPDFVSANINSEGLSLGPSMSCAEFTAREDIKSLFPGLVEAAFLIGSTQVQGRASIGGNLCNASPAADTIPALMVNNALCVIQGPKGERRVSVEDFVTGVASNCMAKNELLKAILVATPASRTSDAYLRFIPRSEMDIAVAGAAVSVTLETDGTCSKAIVAIGAVAPTAILVDAAAKALIGSKLDETSLQAAADAASAASNPITDRRGTAEFRRHVVGVLVKRAALIAAKRAGDK
ncbi:MAG: xanthine dehydrogenase family protein subunit M [Pseudomonadales bacterium]|nr:xanthine dehydrogenase family protein subunit M [Pseudomonadales bacterium]